jgi:predicted tellurium resistance membrane protein TerC
LLPLEALLALATLTPLELVLGVDKIIFISILVDRLPPSQREFAQRIGLVMAMRMRVGLLLVLAWITWLVKPLFTVLGEELSGRDLILILGGLFLVWKSTTEIHHALEGHEQGRSVGAKKPPSPRSSSRSCWSISCFRSTRSSLRWVWSMRFAS